MYFQPTNVLFNSPVHNGVCRNERRSDVEHLMTETTESVEDSGVPEVGEHALAVGGERIGCDALLSARN